MSGKTGLPRFVEWNQLMHRCPDIPLAVKGTLGTLATWADNDSFECFRTQKQLAEDLGVDPRSVRRHLAAAEELGWLVKVRRGRNGRATDFRLAYGNRSSVSGSGADAARSMGTSTSSSTGHQCPVEQVTSVPPSTHQLLINSEQGAARGPDGQADEKDADRQVADFLDAYGKPVQDRHLPHVREAYLIALKKVDADTLSWAASSYRAKQRGRAEQYQKSPQTWLGDELWTKEPTADEAIDKLVEECGTVGGVANRLGVAYNPPLRLDEIEDLAERAAAYREHGAEWMRENRGKLARKLREQGPPTGR